MITIFIFVLTWGAGWGVGLRFAFLNAILAGVCEIIPNFGPIISGVISTVLALVFGSSRFDLPNWQFALIMIAVCIVIQLLQNWLISPLIIGKKMELHPVIVFVGMLVFSMVFGFWGMILAVPVMGTIREIYRYSVREQEKKEKAAEDKLQPLS